MTQLRFLFHTLVTVPPLPAPRSEMISRSSSLTKSSPFLSLLFFVLLVADFFLTEDELESLCVARVVGVEGPV